MQTIASAYLEADTYPISGKPYYIVRCDHADHGAIALNSGHHYEDRTLAEALAARHDAEEHPTPKGKTTMRTLIIKLIHRLGRNTKAEREMVEDGLFYYLQEAIYWKGTARAYPFDVPLLAAYRAGGETWETFRRQTIERKLAELREEVTIK